MTKGHTDMAKPINPQYDPDRIPIGQTEAETPDPLARWIFIERETEGDPDVYVGPFTGENADEDAATCMNESSLVEGLLQPAGGGGTDCFVTVDQPDPDRDEVVVIDHDDPDQTGKPPEVSGIEAVSLAIFGLNTLMEPSASDDADVDELKCKADAAIDTLVELREWLVANPEWEERRSW